jgi:Zn finger protein HypA/HybF involved in hydrogenase expression
MHEAVAMQGMVRTVLEYMRQAGGSRVTNVQLVLGASRHFTAEAAYQHFESLTKGTPVADASLTIQWLPAKFLCLSCLHRFESSEPVTQVTCPICGEVALEVAHADVCYVSAIDVAFEDARDTGELVAVEEALPEIHVLSNECYVATPQRVLSIETA